MPEIFATEPFEVTQHGVGTNRYSYSFNDPVNKLDPNGNEAFVVISGNGSRSMWAYDHASIVVVNQGGPNAIYDPNGSFMPTSEGVKSRSVMGTRELLGGGDAISNFGSFLSYQTGDGTNPVAIYGLNTSPTQDEILIGWVLNSAGGTFLYCATACSDAIREIPEFSDLSGSMFPQRLAREMQSLVATGRVREVKEFEPRQLFGQATSPNDGASMLIDDRSDRDSDDSGDSDDYMQNK
ncbi:hypothetical protein [Roseinatronobacter alkalisoli]|uniref:RHS repeat-associated core domain-containing protein n=1 Tax=Roseinatronobacter alkalisoli TaxID=3028235 RepID=A0ABT5TDC0_9RHOB|nr:hypothetical protein [Roseinatronobacter sp. HJB301]MDD7972979.1 hypothetical protein [Roseinatronobacter sp. HJB301]